MDWGISGIVTGLAVILALIYYFVKQKLSYFKNRSIPYLALSQTWKSNIKIMILKEPFEYFLDDIYKRMKIHKICGFYQFLQPTLVVTDPELVETILIKDFSHFMDHGGEMDIETNPLDGNLFSLKGQQWRTLRNKLSPIFTTGKIKWMFDQIITCGDNLVDYFDKIATGDDVLFKDAISSYGMDVIASCAFGIDTQALKNPDSQFVQKAKKIFKPTTYEFFKQMFRFIFPKLAKLLKIKSIPEDVDNFFMDMSKSGIEQRMNSGIKRNDFVQLLLQLKQKGYVEYDEKLDKEDMMENKEISKDSAEQKYVFTDEVLAAQTFIFFAAGFETASTPVAYTLYFLSLDEEKQNKVREEIIKNIQLHGVTYEGMKNMTYLDCCISETLRLMPHAPFMLRECTKTYKLDNLTIDKGTAVMIPVYSLHYDEQYYDQPTKYMPERFLDSKYSLRQGCGVYLPFGDGPRVCIARRFALLQVKVALVKILENFQVLESSKNLEPLKRDPSSFTVQPKGGLHIRVKRIKN